jgi:class 3 adenylate cyclase
MTELPSGTVTFLFTDIEGSTELLKRLGDAYGEVLATHRRLLREAFTEQGGQEMGTEGDALFFWFPGVRQAVRGAANAQRSLAEHPWAGGEAVRVRMGLHTGEPSVVESEYVGLGVHRAARVCSAAHGGQVLLSHATGDVAADDRATGVSVRELGDYRLKDIDRPERLFQLVIDGLPEEFPPVRAEKVGLAAEPASGSPPPRRGLRRPLALALVAVGVLAAGGAAAAVLLTSGGGHAKTGLSASGYVRQVDRLLNSSQRTIDRVSRHIQQVDSGSLSGTAALNQAHDIAAAREAQLAELRAIRPPPRFERSHALLVEALTLSLADDRRLEDWTRAQVSGGKTAAAAELTQVAATGLRATKAKRAFLAEYGRIREQALGLAPDTLPTTF